MRNKVGTLFILLGLIACSSALADPPPGTMTAAQCVGMLESGGSTNYTSSNSWNFGGKYGFGVAAAMSSGLCVNPTGSALSAMFPGCPHSNYHSCNKWNNVKNGKNPNMQNWAHCTWTPAAIALGANNNNPSGNFQMFLNNPALQELGNNTFMAQSQATAQNLYNQYYSQCGGVINGTPITVANIQYLVHHGGAGGAQNFMSSCGANAACDSYFTKKKVCLDLSWQKMDNCMNGRALNTGISSCDILGMLGLN